MKSLEELHRAWQQVAENRISAAQDEGAFESLAGLGRPLEEIVDITDPHGWIRRTLRDCRATSRSSLEKVARVDAADEASSHRA